MTATTKATGAASGKGARGLGDAVLDAGVALIDQQGWDQTTLDQIAKKAGVPLERVLRRYPTRDHLAVAVFDEIMNEMLDELSEEIEAKANLEARLVGMVARELRLLARHKVFARAALGRLFVPFSPAVALQAPLAARFIAHASEQIAVARDRHQISRWIIPSVAGAAFWALHLQILGEWLRTHHSSHEATLALVDRRIHTFVRTLGGRVERHHHPHHHHHEKRETSEEVVFEALAGNHASRAFLVTNGEADRLDVVIRASTFHSSRDKEDTVEPEFHFKPQHHDLDPGSNTIVRATVVIPSSLRPGVEYRGRLHLVGSGGPDVTAILVRLPDAMEDMVKPREGL